MTCICGSCPSHGDDSNPLGWVVMTPQLGCLTTAEQDDIPIHAVPDNDSHKHYVDYDGQCACNPWIDDEADDLVWVHRAFDGREDYAQGRKRLN